MNKTSIFLLGVIALLFSCAPEDSYIEEPVPLIEESKMIEILTDVHIIEGSRTGLSIMGDTVGIAVYYQRLFAKYDVTKESYQENFNYYLKDPDRMDLMYEKVIENLSILESEEAEKKK